MPAALSSPAFLWISPWLNRFTPAVVEKMAKREKGVVIRHPGTGLAHHRPDVFPHDGAEAMDGTPGTGCFALLKGALCEAFGAIGQEFTAGWTDIRLRAVKIPAVKPDHGFNGPGFSLYPGVFCRHGRFC
jgi:hypothetical protein